MWVGLSFGDPSRRGTTLNLIVLRALFANQLCENNKLKGLVGTLSKNVNKNKIGSKFIS